MYFPVKIVFYTREQFEKYLQIFEFLKYFYFFKFIFFFLYPLTLRATKPLPFLPALDTFSGASNFKHSYFIKNF